MKKQTFIDRAHGEPFVAGDGALIFELFRETGLGIRNLSVATGILWPKQKAKPHFHKISEEIYYIVSGRGKVRVHDRVEDIKTGNAVFIPIGAVHALENTSRNQPLKVLAVSSPPYSDSDMFFCSKQQSNIL